MTFIKKLGNAVVDCISKPIDVLCEWASEPLKANSHEREEYSKQADHDRNMEATTAQARVHHEIKTREMTLAVDLDVRRVREIESAIAEIQEWKKEKEFERMERTSAAIARYHEQLTKLNIETISAIGNMQLELKDRAQRLVYERSTQYKRLQSEAFEDAINDFQRIDSQFGDNERAKDILSRAADLKLSSILDASTRFIEELNRDIVKLNESIDSLTIQGQKFIENHLEHFHVSNVNSPLALEDNHNVKSISYNNEK